MLIRKLLVLLLVITLPFAFTNCGKKGGGTGGAAEENLVIAIDPDPGTSTAKALGSTYEVRLIIQSKMPPQGVTVNVTYKSDTDNRTIFSQTLQTTTSPLIITINNVPFNEVGTVTIEVISKTKATNTATKSFKLVRK